MLLWRAIQCVAEEPRCLGSKARDDILAGLRSFHLGLAARRRGAASHVLFYEERAITPGATTVVILRVLHDRMDPEQHFD